MKNNHVETFLGNDEFLTSVGELYYLGIGLEKNYDEAFSFYQKAAILGNSFAMGKLGMCYENGKGARKNFRAALDCYEKASNQGDVYSLIRIGDFYWHGKKHFYEKDPQQAFEYYLNAYQNIFYHGDRWNAPDVYLRLADCFFEGMGTEKNDKVALAYYDAAIDGFYGRMNSGDLDVQTLLERCEKRRKQCLKQLKIHDESANPSLLN